MNRSRECDDRRLVAFNSHGIDDSLDDSDSAVVIEDTPDAFIDPANLKVYSYNACSLAVYLWAAVTSASIHCNSRSIVVS